MKAIKIVTVAGVQFTIKGLNPDTNDLDGAEIINITNKTREDLTNFLSVNTLFLIQKELDIN